jgi:Na+/proline symporter
MWFMQLKLSVIFKVSVLFKFQGGLKAAITADVVQGLSMIACSLAIIIYGSIDVGGFGKVVDVSSERGRLQFFQ